MAQLLEGTRVRDAIYEELRPRVAALRRPPGLAVVLVGGDPASEIYVRNKVKACAELGLASEKLTPPDTISTDELTALVRELNEQPEIDGILVQMPLPKQVDAREVLLSVDPAKDVDGFHPFNVGLLVGNQPGPRACTPSGVMRMLRHYGISVKGKHAVVVGRSDIVGKPMAMMLLHEHATVTICHSRTPDLAATCRRADILVVAIGRTAMVTEEFISEGAVVVDVGMNRVTDREEAERLFAGDARRLDTFARTGSVLVGDVLPKAMAERSSAYTPVPGGVGPLTIAMLMANTVEAAERRQADAQSWIDGRAG
ncbi:MAG: bifunctional methylenetetrahydrofolate dehydrogenase/methenyltetrahydrofolate cyclohydrolase FolD [Bryobacterales bacterium]|nr:bifunctional methylenetetrahydrofolate dehydrogenase/methenyltetrahydrofolate cyclohydrolase FolD [Bryobacterales bacterium]